MLLRFLLVKLVVQNGEKIFTIMTADAKLKGF